MYSYTCMLLPSLIESNIYNFMALFHFIVLSLCIACCIVDARSKALLNEQNHFTASDSTMVLSLAYWLTIIIIIIIIIKIQRLIILFLICFTHV
jgi:hypothetical protein